MYQQYYCLFGDLSYFLYDWRKFRVLSSERRCGLPVVIAIIIFIVFYVMNLTVENITWKGKLNPYFGAWLLIWFYFLLVFGSRI